MARGTFKSRHHEKKAILKAVRENDRMVLIGIHRRVSPHNISVMEFLKSGKASRVSQVKALINYGQGEPVPDEEPLAGLDWDFWVGPAVMKVYNKQIHPRGFRQYLNFANGTMVDWGIHWFDGENYNIGFLDTRSGTFSSKVSGR